MSCYGKRSEPEPFNGLEFPDYSDKEESYEKFITVLVMGCRNGNDKSCESVLKMLLMNSK